jgi:hypothetical protein
MGRGVLRMILYELSIIVDQEWLDILNVISRNQDGFIWREVDAAEYVEVGDA